MTNDNRSTDGPEDQEPLGEGFPAGIFAAIKSVVRSGKADRVTTMVAGFFAAFAALCIIGLLSVMFASVVFRYFFNSPIQAAEEIIAFLLALTIFSAIPFVTMNRGHIQIELLTGLTRGFRKIEALRRMVIDIGVFCMMIFLAYVLLQQATRFLDRGTISEGQGWPLAPIVFVIVVLLGLAAWVQVATIVSAFRRKAYTTGSDFEKGESF